MRRTDREITGKTELLRLLDSFDALRLGLFDAAYPYVVPVNFARDPEAPEPVLYFHAAPEGKKTGLLQKNAHVCIEADRSGGFLQTRTGITTVYESVIGYGVCEAVTDAAEKLRALRLLLRRIGSPGYDPAACASLARTAVWRITLSELTGKRNGAAFGQAEPSAAKVSPVLLTDKE